MDCRSACAKVNLSLLVGPLRDDGYHDIWTVFAPVTICDEIEFAISACAPGGVRPSLLVQCPGVPQADNLVTKALRSLEAETGWCLGGFVNIQKVIPTASGLGGGSSDAAAALRAGAEAIEAAGGPSTSDHVLRKLACGLGADVSFFLDARPSVGRGVGELLEPLPLPEIPLVLLLPQEELSAGEVYQTYDGVASAESSSSFRARYRVGELSWRALSDAWVSADLSVGAAITQSAGLLMNDLEAACLHLLPSLKARRDALAREGALGAIISGSGPTVFGVFASPEDADEAGATLRALGYEAYRAATMAGSFAAA